MVTSAMENKCRMASIKPLPMEVRTKYILSFMNQWIKKILNKVVSISLGATMMALLLDIIMLAKSISSVIQWK
jgi:hypothetical protein